MKSYLWILSLAFKRSALPLFWLFLLGSGCTDNRPVSDSGLAADSVGPAFDATIDISPLARVVDPPRFTDWPCSVGWLPEEVGAEWGVAHDICQPPEQLECPLGAVQFLGEEACHPIGSDCPTDDFLDENTIRALAPGFEGKIIYVLPGSGDGNGTRSAPLGSIAAAMSSANSGEIVALGKHTFAELVWIRQRIALVGSCVNGTKINTPAPTASSWVGLAILDDASGALLTNLRVSGGRDGVWMGQKGGPRGTATIRGIEVQGAEGAGIVITEGSTVSIDDVVVRDLKPSASDEDYGQGLVISHGAAVNLRRAVFIKTRQAGIWIDSAATLLDSTTTATLEDIVVRDTQPRLDKTAGVGLLISGDAEVELSRGLVERNFAAGIVIDTYASMKRSQTKLQEIVVRDTAVAPGREKHDFGFGLTIRNKSDVSVTRGLFERNLTGALGMGRDQDNDPPLVVLEDIVARETDSVLPATGGVGIAVEGGGNATLRRGYFSRNRGVGVLVAGGPTDRPTLLDATDLLVADTQCTRLARYGRGLEVAGGNFAARVTRGFFMANRDAGVIAVANDDDSQPLLDLTQVVIRDTIEEECAFLPADDPLTCLKEGVRWGGGTAIVASNGAVTVTEFELGNNALCGLQVGFGGTLSASRGEIHHNPIGANVQIEGYDMELLANESVRYYANERNLATEKLPLPEPNLP